MVPPQSSQPPRVPMTLFDAVAYWETPEPGKPRFDRNDVSYVYGLYTALYHQPSLQPPQNEIQSGRDSLERGPQRQALIRAFWRRSGRRHQEIGCGLAPIICFQDFGGDPRILTSELSWVGSQPDLCDYFLFMLERPYQIGL
jgi:hypothetical protein